jgi:biotin carboxyl carrier protein
MDPSRSGLNIDTAKGSDAGRNIWGEFVVFNKKFEPGERVHLLLTWGPNGIKDNKVYANGVEAVGYYKGTGEQAFSRDAKMVDVIPPDYKLRVGDAYQTHLNGSWLEKLVINDVILGPPSIDRVSHDVFRVAGYSGKLVAGDTFTVILKAAPGGTATFDLIQPASTSREVTIPEKVRIVGHPMSEDPENPGTYTGVHIVKYGEDVKDGQIIGHFVNAFGVKADPVPASRKITVDTRVYMDVRANNDLVPADGESKSGITIISRDANGKAIRGHELKLTLSTTDEYTGTVGGGSFEDLVGGSIDVDWGGITDSFGEVNAQYLSGFAAKTTLVSAKNMVTGDVDVAWVRSYIDGTVDIVVTEPRASALSVAGSMDVSLSRDWLTADGRSRSRITAVVEDASGKFLSGHSVQFTLLGDNGSIRVIQGKTDSRGRAMADYIAGIVMGQVQVEVRDMTSGMVAIVPIELRPDAPAEIILAADPGEVVTGGQSTVTAKVTDANGNPNRNVDVLYDVSVGEGAVSAPSVSTDEKGNASVAFTSGKAGLVTVRGTVISREPTAEEISAAQGAVFLYGLDEDPGRLEVVEWLVEAGDEVVEGQDLVTLEDRRDNLYNVVAPRDGVVSTFVAEERDRVEYGDTLGYVIEKPE